MNLQELILQEDFTSIISNIGLEKLRKFKKKTIFITGANGFIGNFLVKFFSSLNKNFNYEIRLILLIREKYSPDTKPSLSLKKNILKKIEIKQKIDYIFHLASITSPFLLSHDPIQSLKVNILGTLNILESIKDKKIKKFLYFSSSAIYGVPDQKNIPIPETFTGNVPTMLSRSCYAESKRVSESISQAYAFQYKIPINILRPFHIYGPTMNLEKDNALNYFLNCGFKNQDILLNSNGQETRSFCYITDAISIILLVALTNKSGEVFNVGNEKTEIKIINLAKIIAKIFNDKIAITITKKNTKKFYKETLTRNVPSMSKVKKMLNFTSKINLKKGLSRIVKNYGTI